MPRRYIFALIVIAIVFIGGVALLTKLLSSNKSPDTPAVSQTVQKQKAFTKDARQVSFTTYGAVVGDDERRAIRITINAQQRVVEVLSGYQEQIIKDKYQYNTQDAFDNLLVALEAAGFNRYQPDYEVDQRSQCVTGKRYSYGIEYFEFDDVYSWSTSCSKSQGNFRGDKSLVEDLMQDQITDYSEFVSGVNL